jgi:hypothetical protein
MPFYRDHVYPHLVSALGNPKPIEDIRRRIVPLAQGSVLEIGVGPGVNFAHSLVFEHGLSPDPPVRRWQQRSEPLFRWVFEGCQLTKHDHHSRNPSKLLKRSWRSDVST